MISLGECKLGKAVFRGLLTELHSWRSPQTSSEKGYRYLASICSLVWIPLTSRLATTFSNDVLLAS